MKKVLGYSIVVIFALIGLLFAVLIGEYTSQLDNIARAKQQQTKLKAEQKTLSEKKELNWSDQSRKGQIEEQLQHLEQMFKQEADVDRVRGATLLFFAFAWLVAFFTWSRLRKEKESGPRLVLIGQVVMGVGILTAAISMYLPSMTEGRTSAAEAAPAILLGIVAVIAGFGMWKKWLK